MNALSAPIRSATSWQKQFCEICREDTTHHKGVCIHCRTPAAGSVGERIASFNWRGAQQKLTPAKRAEARRMLNEGASPRAVAALLRVSPATIYRLNPLMRG